MARLSAQGLTKVKLMWLGWVLVWRLWGNINFQDHSYWCIIQFIVVVGLRSSCPWLSFRNHFQFIEATDILYYVAPSIFQHRFKKYYPIFSELPLQIVKDPCSYIYRSIFKLSISFYWYICQYFCQYHSVCITVLL